RDSATICAKKYRRQAEHPPRQRLPIACCATAQRYAPDSNGIILQNKKTAVRRNIRREAAASRLPGGSPATGAKLQRHSSSNRRDDRAMMTKKERGDVNFRSRASPLF
ncbi:MAG: hypothetical protein J6R86_02150, partial [Lentisphaeria bacterium]|nr:hypothetical protein [Lentisphaeria bacterium]